MLDLIRNRFPRRSDIISVFSVAVFVCFSWSLLGFLNKFSSFILYFTIEEIAEIFAFMMAFALLESLAVTGLLALLSALLPVGWLRDEFALKGFVSILVFTITSIILQKLLDGFPSIYTLIAVTLTPLAAIALILVTVRSLPKFRNILLNIEDRIQIMLFVYVPMGLLSLVVVLYRNLL